MGKNEKDVAAAWLAISKKVKGVLESNTPVECIAGLGLALGNVLGFIVGNAILSDDKERVKKTIDSLERMKIIYDDAFGDALSDLETALEDIDDE